MARFFERRAGPLFCLQTTVSIVLLAAVRYQPNRDYRSNDDIPTPPALAQALVKALSPRGLILEPCAGTGSFLAALPAGSLWCEIKQGRDFLSWQGRVDWIITNPPWSQIRTFLQKSFAVADHVAFLMTINHAWTRARLRDMRQAGFGLREFILVETPHSFPPTGFQLGLVVYARHWSGPIALHELRGQWD
jgi:hypothetical protein